MNCHRLIINLLVKLHLYHCVCEDYGFQKYLHCNALLHTKMYLPQADAAPSEMCAPWLRVK